MTRRGQEAIIEDVVCKYAVEQYDMWVRKFTSPGRRHVPDRIFVPKYPIGVPPLVTFIEFKAPGEQLRLGQERELARLRARGVPTFVVDDETGGKTLVDTIADPAAFLPWWAEQLAGDLRAASLVLSPSVSDQGG